jgi:sugar phosphate permease
MSDTAVITPRPLEPEQKLGGTEHVDLCDRLDDEKQPGGNDNAVSDHPTMTARENRLVRRVDFYVLPILAIIFAVSIIDRINVGSARVLGMQQDLQLTGNRYNVILQTFFPAYLLAELPSNYILVKVNPKNWLSFLVIAWGAVLTGMGFTNNWKVVAFVRFLLGIFEGGVLPGIVYIISCWYVIHQSLGILGIPHTDVRSI